MKFALHQSLTHKATPSTRNAIRRLLRLDQDAFLPVRGQTEVVTWPSKRGLAYQLLYSFGFSSSLRIDSAVIQRHVNHRIILRLPYLIGTLWFEV